MPRLHNKISRNAWPIMAVVMLVLVLALAGDRFLEHRSQATFRDKLFTLCGQREAQIQAIIDWGQRTTDIERTNTFIDARIRNARVTSNDTMIADLKAVQGDTDCKRLIAAAG